MEQDEEESHMGKGGAEGSRLKPVATRLQSDAVSATLHAHSLVGRVVKLVVQAAAADGAADVWVTHDNVGVGADREGALARIEA
eukprot:603238-Pleurochrysis_carterae.AAC.1